MWTVAEVSSEMQQLLTDTANRVASETGFVQRTSKVTGAHFAQAMVLGWLNNPQATLQQLAQMAGTVGVLVSPQGLEQRFTPAAARFLHGLVETAIQILVSGEPAPIPLLQRFHGVYLLDSSTIVLDEALGAIWHGSGGGGRATHGRRTAAAVRLQVQFDLVTGQLIGPFFQHGRSHDRAAPRQEQFPAGALRISDLGYFSTDIFTTLHQQGVYWLSRLHMLAQLFDTSGKRLPMERLPAWLEQHARHRSPVPSCHTSLTAGGQAGRQERKAQPQPPRHDSQDVLDAPLLLGSATGVPIRLLALRVPEEVATERRRQLTMEAKRKGQRVSAHRLALAPWTLLVTNAPPDLVSLDQAVVLARARWQIELLFKLWKQQGVLDASRSRKPWRQLCEFYAKMLGLIIQHWLLILSCWRYPDRSLTQAAQTIRRYATTLALALPYCDRLASLLTHLCRCLSVGCRITKRKKAPATYQHLLAAAPGP